MARMFTRNHQRLKGRLPTSPHFHGEECEELMKRGIELKDTLHWSRSIIFAKRKVRSKHFYQFSSPRRRLLLIQTAKQDHGMSEKELIKMNVDAQRELKECAARYTELHEARHGY